MDVLETARRKRRAIGLSLAAAATLTALKLVVYFATGSVALLSETLHSLTDLLAVLIAFAAVRRATAPPSAAYRYGHGRAENLSALAEGAVVILAALAIAGESIRFFFVAHEVEAPLLATAVMAFAALVYVALAWYLGRAGRTLNSPALTADSKHVLTDVYSATGVAIALAVVAATGFVWLDPLIALLVAALVVRLGVGLVRDSARVLLDASLAESELDEVREILQEPLPGVTGYHRLRSRRAGARRHLDLHLTFVPNLTLERAHALASEVERKLHQRLDNLDVVIHLEPDAESPPLGADSGASDLETRELGEMPELVHHKYERKFLLKQEPDWRRLEALGAEVVEIEQHYLLSADPGREERVRRVFRDGAESHYWTTKHTAAGMAREIEEQRLTHAEYVALLARSDPRRHPIRKTRYSFAHAGNLYEVDVFALPVRLTVLEVEMPRKDAPLALPDFIETEREVTEDPEFLNATISTTLAQRQAQTRQAWLADLAHGDAVWVFARSAESDTAGYGEVVGREDGRVTVRTRGADVAFDQAGQAAKDGVELALERPGTRR